MNHPPCLSCEDSSLVFVFGSNARGEHLGGAAAHAYKHHGARWGQGNGAMVPGVIQSFAIDTMSGFEELKAEVARFLSFARALDRERFFVTKIGCGIAGYTEDQISPLFADAPPNCILPKGWRK